MSEGLNRAQLLGNLGADPELRFTEGNGSAVLNLRLATSVTWWDKKKEEEQERTEWHSVVVWGKRAEGLAKILSKGDKIYVEGDLRTRDWEKDGVKQYRTEIHASEVLLCGGGKGGGGSRDDRGGGDDRSSSRGRDDDRGRSDDRGRGRDNDRGGGRRDDRRDERSSRGRDSDRGEDGRPGRQPWE